MTRPRPMRRRTSAARRWLYAVVVLAVIGASLVIGLVVVKRVLTGQWQRPTGDDLVWMKDRVRVGLGKQPTPPRIIYLRRGPITIRGGRTDSHEDHSMIVSESADHSASLPGFSSTDRRWRQIVSCVETLFAPFEVTVTETRPQRRGYVMVVVGGRDRDLGGHGKQHARGKVGGLSPFNGNVVADPIVFAFSRTLGNRARAVCETIGMEVAHAYGLDHSYECKDVMTYKDGCRKSFLDKEVRCGESKPRECHGGSPTQNSYRHLLGLLGPRNK